MGCKYHDPAAYAFARSLIPQSFCVIPAIRIFYAVQDDDSSKQNYFVATSLEPNFGIIVACFPLLWPVVLELDRLLMGRPVLSNLTVQPHSRYGNTTLVAGTPKSNIGNESSNFHKIKRMPSCNTEQASGDKIPDVYGHKKPQRNREDAKNDHATPEPAAAMDGEAIDTHYRKLYEATGLTALTRISYLKTDKNEPSHNGDGTEEDYATPDSAVTRCEETIDINCDEFSRKLPPETPIEICPVLLRRSVELNDNERGIDSLLGMPLEQQLNDTIQQLKLNLDGFSTLIDDKCFGPRRSSVPGQARNKSNSRSTK